MNASFMDASKRSSATTPVAPRYISISTSSSSSSSDESDAGYVTVLEEFGKRHSSYQIELEGSMIKKPKLEVETVGDLVPPGFLDSPPPPCVAPLAALMPKTEESAVVHSTPSRVNRQFSKAGEFYEEDSHKEPSAYSGGLDHLRVHPKFLHSNATSHKWGLGAFAELLDNAVDEVCNGATYVNVDVLKNKKDGSKMLLVQDNGGGMTPEKMRMCMSLGYSSKSKNAKNIDGNGFKTSTMRLGADVIVFSRCQGKDGSPTQSIGILSYTFLRSTKQEDIVVPLIDYEKKSKSWKKLMKSSADDWNRNLKTIVQWSPYSSEQDLLQQFNFLESKGTRIIIYNLWEDDEGNVELDFETDPHDIQIRGANRDEKKIRMAKQYPNSSHFLTYEHSLRSYSAILYQKLPSKFRIILRGKDVKHHRIENDMMLTEETTYKPKDLHISENGVAQIVVVPVKIGFVKDAHHHIDIQGFNVYHKNRLIKPFWRVWNASGSGGRGVIGVLEANFIKPAHDKQGFEHTPALTKLEARLGVIQKKYWHANSQEIGYGAQKHIPDTEQKSEFKDKSRTKSSKNSDNIPHHSSQKAVPVDTQRNHEHNSRASHVIPCSDSKSVVTNGNGCTSDDVISKLEEEIRQLQHRLAESAGSTMVCLLDELDHERKKSKLLANQLDDANKKLDEAAEEQEAVIMMLSQERAEREEVEERLRKKLRDASETMDNLFERIKQLERKGPTCKI